MPFPLAELVLRGSGLVPDFRVFRFDVATILTRISNKITILGNTDSQQQDGDCLWRLAPTRKGCRTELVRETKQNLLPYISRYDVHPPTDSWTVTQPESPAEGPSTVTQSNPPPGLSHTDTLGEQGFRHELLLSEHHSPVFDEPLLHVQLDLESSEISFGSLSHWLLILLLETAPEPVHFPQVYEPHFSHHEPRPYVREPKRLGLGPPNIQL